MSKRLIEISPRRGAAARCRPFFLTNFFLVELERRIALAAGLGDEGLAPGRLGPFFVVVVVVGAERVGLGLLGAGAAMVGHDDGLVEVGDVGFGLRMRTL